jgi:hypothetical protein
VLVLAGVAGCSGDDGGEEPTAESSVPTVEAFSGSYRCDDGTADQLDADSGVVAPSSVPATDLVSAEVEQVNGDLVIVLETAGEISAPEATKFQVSKGVPDTDSWFEARVTDVDGQWVVAVATAAEVPESIPKGASVAVEEVETLPVPAVAESSTITFTLPLQVLPPVDAGETWQFGSRSDGTPTLIDECSEFTLE